MKYSVKTLDEFVVEAKQKGKDKNTIPDIIDSITNYKWSAKQKKILDSMVPAEKKATFNWIESIKATMQGKTNIEGSMDWLAFDKELMATLGDKPQINGMDARDLFIERKTFSKWLDNFLNFYKGALYFPGQQVGSWNAGILARVIAAEDLGFENQLKEYKYNLTRFEEWLLSADREHYRGWEDESNDWEKTIEKEEEKGKYNWVKKLDAIADKIHRNRVPNSEMVSRG